MTKTLAIEWGPYNGIRINCVAPGLIISSGMKNYHETMVDLLAHSHWMVSQGGIHDLDIFFTALQHARHR